MDIREFITARLDELEAVARRFAEGNDYDTLMLEVCCLVEHDDLYRASVNGSAFLGVLTPARVITEVAAKRRLLRSYTEATDFWTSCEIPANRLAVKNQALALHFALRLAAAPHADHPDYDPAWRVEGV